MYVLVMRVRTVYTSVYTLVIILTLTYFRHLTLTLFRHLTLTLFRHLTLTLFRHCHV